MFIFQDLIFQCFFGGGFYQLDKVISCYFGNKYYVCVWYLFVYKELMDICWEQLECVELVEVVLEFEFDYVYDEGYVRYGFVVGFDYGGVVYVVLQEGDEVGVGLVDDEVVYVEEFGDVEEGGFLFGVGGVGLVVEVDFVGGFLGDDVVLGVFVEDFGLMVVVEGGCGGVGGDGGGLDQLWMLVMFMILGEKGGIYYVRSC